jgi:hypothetical protein
MQATSWKNNFILNVASENYDAPEIQATDINRKLVK